MVNVVSLALLGVALIIVVINVIMGVIRGLQKSLGNLAGIILGAVGAFITTSMLCKPYSVIALKVTDILSQMLSGSAGDIFALNEVNQLVSVYAVMLAAPIVFLAAFILLSIIFSVICGIIFKKIPQIFKEKNAANRLSGLATGAVCGILVALLVISPFAGTIGIVLNADLGAVIGEEGEGAEILKEAQDDKILTALVSVSNPLYNMMASVKVNGEKVYLTSETEVLADVISQVPQLKGKISEYGDEQIGALYGIVDTIEKSPMLKSAIAAVVAEAAGAMSNGEEFMGISEINAGEIAQPMVDTLLRIMASSNEDTITKDMTTAVEIFEVVVDSGLLAEKIDYKETLSKLGEGKLIERLLTAVNKNERMVPLADEITMLSVRAIAAAFELPANSAENYENVMTDLSNAVAEIKSLPEEERKEKLSTEIAGTMDKYGVEIDRDAAVSVAEGIIADLGGVENITATDVEEFFIVYALAELDKAVTSYAYDKVEFSPETAYDLSKMADTKGKNKFDVVIGEDRSLTVDGRLLKNYNADNYKQSAAFTSGSSGTNIGDASSLYSAEAMKSSIVTVDKIIEEMGSYADCKDVTQEAQKVQEMVSGAVDLFTGKEITKDSIPEIISGMGNVLDNASNTEIIGQKAAGSLLTAIMQSGKMQDSLGISSSKATEVADSINNIASKENGSFSNATDAIAGTLTVITGAKDTEKTKEEKTEDAKEMLQNITPDSAELMSTMSTPEMLESFGVPEKNSQQVSDMVGVLFENMAEYDPKTEEDQAQFDKEAEAVNQMIQLAISTYDSSASHIFTANGERGKLDSTAYELVVTIMESNVITKTVDRIIYGDGTFNGNPLNIPDLSADDAKQVTDALNKYYSEHGAEEGVEKKLKAIAGLVNVEIDF